MVWLYKLNYSILNIGAHARLSSKHPFKIGADYYHNLADYVSISEIETLFQDQNQGFAIYLNYGQLNEKKDEKAFYQTEIKDIKESLYELETNNITQEKFAREKYFMKRADEDVFVVMEEEK